jgi:hypothetical protein
MWERVFSDKEPRRPIFDRRKYQKIFIADLEPGGVYEGHTGQRREIVSMDGDKIVYRVTAEAFGQRIKAPVGSVWTVKDRTFRDWVAEEVA